MDEMLAELIRDNAAKDIAMQGIVALLEEIRPGSKAKLMASLSQAADNAPDEGLADALEDMIDSLNL